MDLHLQDVEVGARDPQRFAELIGPERTDHLLATGARLAELLAADANFETWSARLVETLPNLVQEMGAPGARGRESSSALA